MRNPKIYLWAARILVIAFVGIVIYDASMSTFDWWIYFQIWIILFTLKDIKDKLQ